MLEKRKHDRFLPLESLLVKEDNGEMINYYHLSNISMGGMYLLKKISSKSDRICKYTFLVPELENLQVKGRVIETRLNNGTYGTAIRFDDESEQNVSLVIDVLSR
jgi:hypothetical protein